MTNKGKHGNRKQKIAFFMSHLSGVNLEGSAYMFVTSLPAGERINLTIANHFAAKLNFLTWKEVWLWADNFELGLRKYLGLFRPHRFLIQQNMQAAMCIAFQEQWNLSVVSECITSWSSEDLSIALNPAVDGIWCRPTCQPSAQYSSNRVMKRRQV